ncbi:NAD(P)H-dependent oxidoreductase [Priestia sp. AB]|uniref:NAD(P)H-dependent oxidoreductase n=1 Tax=Priestia sp. AB TaxID=3020890 RepID=UPI00232F2BB9|nr:NAD(P)H-dependent oxidoreductase [Priestia sp. AB]MDC0706375.1 NAD(P)H-dependent oxidoreductase [Priestia sp. AB]
MTHSVMNRQEILDAFNFRRAIKAFDPTKKISEDDFNVILESARLSPSSCGYEPWKFLVVQNQEFREKLKEISPGAQGHLPTASHFVIILARTIKDTKYDSEYVKNQTLNITGFPAEMYDQMKDIYKEFQEDQQNILVNESTMLDWAKRQTYLPFANMMTVAALLGIDSCPIEGFYIDKVEKLLAEENLLEDGHLAVSAMVAFGYRANEPKFPRGRKDMKDIVQWIN